MNWPKGGLAVGLLYDRSLKRMCVFVDPPGRQFFSGMLFMSMKNERYHHLFRLAIILLLAICILGLLILPQVNPDNFVLKGRTLLTTFVTHARIILTSSVFTLLIRTGIMAPSGISWSSTSRQSSLQFTTLELIGKPLRR